MVLIKRRRINGNVYLYVVRNYRENGKVKQKYIAYLGREDNLPNILDEYASLKKLTKGELENLSYSAPLELWNLANQIGIPKLFSDNFPKKYGVDAGIASTLMILNYCLESKSKNKLQDWYSETYLKHHLRISAEKINSDLLYHTLDFFNEEKIEELHNKIFQKAKEKFNLSEEATVYDVTALFMEGKQCKFAKRGYNPEAMYKLQVNLGMAITSEKFPIAHKIFDGNIKDVTTFDKVFTLLDKTINLSKTIFIFDRGIKSDKNIDKIIKSDSQYIAGISKNPAVQKQILSINEKDFSLIGDDDYYYEIKEKNNPKRRLIFWNKEMSKVQKKERDKQLKKIGLKLKKINPKRYPKIRFIEKIGGITKGYRNFFEIEYKRFSFKIKENEVKRAEKLDGKSAIETNTNLDANIILTKYRGKNIVEMSFKDLKLFVDIRPIRHRKDNRVLGHVFLAILAFGLRSLLELKLRRNDLQITAEEALQKLYKVRVLCCDGKIIRTTGEDEITKQITQIMSKSG